MNLMYFICAKPSDLCFSSFHEELYINMFNRSPRISRTVRTVNLVSAPVSHLKKRNQKKQSQVRFSTCPHTEEFGGSKDGDEQFI